MAALLLLLLGSSQVTATQLVAWQRAVAGAGGYVAATLVSSPVDVVKTRLQARRDEKGSGALSVAMQMIRSEGVLAKHTNRGMGRHHLSTLTENHAFDPWKHSPASV